MVDAFSLKFQRNNRQNTLAGDSTREKLEKKAVFSPCCRDETTTYDNRAKGIPHKMPNHGAPQRKNKIKSIYFQCTTKTKQPYAVTEPLGTPKE